MVDLYDQFDLPLPRLWELEDNATHYQRVGAAPADEDRITMWTAWSVTTYAFAIYTSSVLLALVGTTKIRKRPFNLFLIYLMIPDTLVLWFCATSCLMNAVAGRFTSLRHCQFQAFYLCFTVICNAWLNAAITRHLLYMLRCAQKFIKYQPPTRKQVTVESLSIYAVTIFVASWFAFADGSDNDNSGWWPFQARLNSGVVCLPQDYSHLSTAFYYAVFFPIGFVAPFGYVCYSVCIIWKQNLMPPSGRKRALAIYFFRLVVAFVVMWVPSLVLLVVTSPWTNPWMVWVGGFWGHLQGVVSGVVSLFKPDIWNAYVDFYRPIWACFFCKQQEQQSTTTDHRHRNPNGHGGGLTTDDCESSSAVVAPPRRLLRRISTASSTGSGFLHSMFLSNQFSRLSRAGSNSGVEDLQDDLEEDDDDDEEEEEEDKEQLQQQQEMAIAKDPDGDEESQSATSQVHTNTALAEESDSISDD